MAETLTLTVTDVRSETPLVRAVTLARPHGEPLPSWQPGAHIRVKLPGGDDRSYSLINLRDDAQATTRPHAYSLGVRLEDPSQGGSRFMHALKAGDTVEVLPPSNNFPLNPGAEPVVLIAGGIGITPIASMAAALTTDKRPYRLCYAGRSREQLAFIKELEALCGDRLALHVDDTAGQLFDIRGLMASLKANEPV